MITIQPIDTVDPAAIEALLDRAFGPDRHARTAYRVRGQAKPIPALSFAALVGERLVGSIQCWPVMLRADDGGSWPITMVGPVAVDPAHQGGGIGRALVTRALAGTGPDTASMLIGDPEYYGRFFGFSAERTAKWRLPGPVEMHRLLARGREVPAVAGELGPVAAADAPLDAREPLA